jgi:hypothetical protein
MIFLFVADDEKSFAHDAVPDAKNMALRKTAKFVPRLVCMTWV